MSSAALDLEAALVVMTRDKKLADYSNLKRIGKSVSRDAYYGANSVVIKATLGGFTLVLKALVTGRVDQTNALRDRFEAELQIGDATKGRLPPSAHVNRAVCTFLDDVHAIPGWEKLQATFGGALADRTFVCVMPYLPLTLKSVVTLSRRGEHPPIDEPLALTWFVQILRGAKHLHDNGIAHRDLKLDNVMMSGEASPMERRVVIMDLGEALDCVEDGEIDWNFPCTSGKSKGGAPMTIPPEVAGVVPSRRALANYSGADAWALGRLLNDMLRDKAPFTTLEFAEMNAETFVPLSDDGCSSAMRDLHAGLLEAELSERLTLDAALACAEEALAVLSRGPRLRPPTPPAADEPMFECTTCYEDERSDAGIFCQPLAAGGDADERHFVCDACLGQHVLAAARGDVRELQKTEGRCYFPAHDECACTPVIEDGELAIHVRGTEGAFEAHIEARKRLLEFQLAGDADKRAAAQLKSELERLEQMSADERKVYAYRLRIGAFERARGVCSARRPRSARVLVSAPT